MAGKMVNTHTLYLLLIGSLLVTCTGIHFDFDEESPIIVLENEKDTITVDDAYAPKYTITDNNDSQQDLFGNVEIWVEDVNGNAVDLATFTEYPGIYYVYLKVTDSDGNTSEIVTLEVLVSEDDHTPPVITILGPKPFILNIGDTYHEPGAKAVDNIDGDISDKIEINGIVNIHTEDDYIITYTVTDDAGNEASAERTVRVKDSQGNDKEKPEIKLLGDNPFVIAVGETYVDPGATATDNVDGNITFNIVKHDTVINTSVPDSHFVYYTVEDDAGNIAIATRTVVVIVVQDTIPPVIKLVGDKTMHLNKGQEYEEPGATAQDNVDGDLTDKIKIDDDEVNIFDDGIYKVYYTVSDAAGNLGEEQRRIVVGIIDTVPPVINLIGPNPLPVDIYGPFNDPGAYATDNIDSLIEFKDFSVDHNINLNEFGTYTITYTVEDAAGNEATKERTAEVVDTIAPKIVIEGPNPINLGLGYPYTEYGIKEAKDHYDGDLTNQVEISGEVNSSVGGTYIITYSVTDSHGNEGKAERQVKVASDLKPPELTLLGDNPMEVEKGSPYIEPGATAWDSVDGDLTNKIVITGGVNTDIIGTYEVTYTVSDTGGNTANDVRIVLVDGDTTAPVLTLQGQNPMNLAAGDNYVEPGATAIDDEDGDITDQIEIVGDVNTSVAGTYTVTYTVSDKAGNEVSKDRTVNVGPDTKPPEITLKGNNPMVVLLGGTYNEPGATAIDNVDGDITDKIVISGSVNTSVLGSYTITYTVSDQAGNEAVKERTVNVDEDVVPPVITLNGDNPMEVEEGAPYVEPGATALDDIDGDLTNDIVITGTVNTSQEGTYTITYTVSDQAGNQAIKERTVNVKGDFIAPVLTLKGDNPMSLMVGDPYVEPGATAIDDVDGNISDSIKITGTVNTSQEGTYTKTYAVSDKAGNQASKERTVNVSSIYVLKASDNNTQQFTVILETSFQINTNLGQISIWLHFTSGSGTVSLDGGPSQAYTSISLNLSAFPSGGKVLITITPSSSTTLRFQW